MAFRTILKKDWHVMFKEVETFPIMFLIGGALAWGTYNGVKFLVYEPDVQWDKKQRGEIIRDNHEDGERWASMASKHNRPAHDGVENVSVWETFGFKRGGPTDR